MDASFPAYSVASSAISNSGNVELVAINNNSGSSVFILSIRGKQYVSGTTANTYFVIEGFRCSASSTGGVNISSSVQRLDTNDPALPGSIIVNSRGTTTPSGAPLFGLAYDIGTPTTIQDFKMYEYRSDGVTKHLRLNPGEIFVVAKAPGTAAVATASPGAIVEFVVTPSSFIDETVQIENTNRNIYAFYTSGYSVSNTANTICLSNYSTSTIRLNMVKYRHTPSATTTSVKPFPVEAFIFGGDVTSGAATVKLTSRLAKFDTSSPDLPNTIDLWRNPDYNSGAFSPGTDRPIFAGAFNTDSIIHQSIENVYCYRGGCCPKQVTIRPNYHLVLMFAAGATAIGGSGPPAAGGFYIEFTVDTA